MLLSSHRESFESVGYHRETFLCTGLFFALVQQLWFKDWLWGMSELDVVKCVGRGLTSG